MKANFLATLMQTKKLNILIWGNPGVGKTSRIQSIAEQLETPLETIIASIHEPSDFLGLPAPQDGHVEYMPPGWAVNAKDNGEGIILFDEISTAPPVVQASLLSVILEKQVGTLTLPDDIMMVAAANPPEYAAGGFELEPPLANRFLHLDWDLDNDEWVDGMMEGFGNEKVSKLPENWEDNIPHHKMLIASFINKRPQLLESMPENESQRGNAYPSPRTWEMSAFAMAALEANNFGDREMLIAVSGCVGSGAAKEFFEWKENLDLPDPEEVLDDPDDFEIPSRGDQVYAILSSIASHVRDHPEQEKFENAWRYTARVADEKDIGTTWNPANRLWQVAKDNRDLDFRPIEEVMEPYAEFRKMVDELSDQ